MLQVFNKSLDQLMGIVIFQILHISFNPSVSLSQTPYDPPSAHFSHFLLAFSTLSPTIHFASTDSTFSTNDVSSVTAEFLDGYLRSYFPK